MLELKGKYGVAKVYTDNIEESALGQLIEICNQPFTMGKSIRVMSDVHSGKGCVIGFTAELGDLVIPNIVGVDINCGVLTVELGKVDIDLSVLDKIIRENVPSGTSRRSVALKDLGSLNDLKIWELGKYAQGEKASLLDRFNKSLGTLGGGNHFIEVASDTDGNKYLMVHTGSRNLGKVVAEFYQDIAIKECSVDTKVARLNLIAQLKAEGKERDIASALEEFDKNTKARIPKELAYLEGVSRDNYLHDMLICSGYASLNRYLICDIILGKLLGKSTKDFKCIETVHNYIDLDSNIIRKGAVSAKEGELLVIPMNMRDGSLVCVGKGNKEWNYSAPHGAGRILSRGKAKELVSLEEFKESMQGVYSTCVSESTLDESPMVYKDMVEIINNIGDTVDILKVIKPIYNFKG